MARAKTVTEAYDKFITYAHQYHLNGKGTMREMKKLLYLTLINVNILEGIRFYVSFACSFAFGELKLMEGSAKIISLIARDENLHLAVSQNIINHYRTKENDKEMLDVMKETEQEVYDMYDIAVQEEKAWATYLFREGSMIGLNDKLLNQYVEFMANKRMKAIGLKGVYDASSTNNPLPWTQHWLNSRGLQNAPQETEIESYVVGGIKQDVETETFKGFKL
jgi:ribonucleoside-diphosphate reductase beta chain